MQSGGVILAPLWGRLARPSALARGCRVLPNFLVIGARRSGTTLLDLILRQYPDIYLPSRRKEVHYFDRYFERGEIWYRSYFPPAEEAAQYRAIGEVTPDYLTVSEAPDRIHGLLPNCRLIVILRNPTDRAYSAYQYLCKTRVESRSFHDILSSEAPILEDGLYFKHLARYIERFGRDSLFVMIFEELVAHPAEQLGKLTSFLDVKDTPMTPALSALKKRINSSEPARFGRAFAIARRCGHWLLEHDINWPVRVAKRLEVTRLFGQGGPPPELDVRDRSLLSTYYHDDIAALSKLLNRDLAIWQTGDAASFEQALPVR